MAKSQGQTGRGLSASKRAQHAPKTVAPAPAPAPEAAPVETPAPEAPAQQEAAAKADGTAVAVVTTPQAAKSVALRGGLAISAVKLTAKAYRVGAAHNQGWFKIIQDKVAAGDGKATVQDIIAAGVPAPFIGYVVRRGYVESIV